MRTNLILTVMVSVVCLVLGAGAAYAAPVAAGTTVTALNGSSVKNNGLLPIEVTVDVIDGITYISVEGDDAEIHLNQGTEVGVLGDNNDIHHDQAGTTADSEGQGNTHHGGQTTPGTSGGVPTGHSTR